MDVKVFYVHLNEHQRQLVPTDLEAAGLRQVLGLDCRADSAGIAAIHAKLATDATTAPSDVVHNVTVIYSALSASPSLRRVVGTTCVRTWTAFRRRVPSARYDPFRERFLPKHQSKLIRCRIGEVRQPVEEP